MKKSAMRASSSLSGFHFADLRQIASSSLGINRLRLIDFLTVASLLPNEGIAMKENSTGENRTRRNLTTVGQTI